ncbi:MAG: hypothetical protein K9I48_06050 [Sphingobacteriales bacterium]|nr:hypothetical protein [Sphingobacteriales bacterium]
MKNKLITYLLIVLVIVVWGLIFMRLFSTSKEEIKSQRVINTKYTIDTSILNTKYTLRLNYTDPFLGQKNKVFLLSKPKKNIKVKEKVQPEPIDAKYLGMISNKKQKSVLALIRLNGEEYYLSVGETINEIKLLNCTETSIVLKKGNTKYIINK